MILDIKTFPGDIVRIDGKQVWPSSHPLNWKLTLPVDVTGGNTGKAAEVSPLMSDYQNAPFFTQADGTMNFIAPVDGATTSGSSYPRCELRELKADGTLAAWSVTDGKRHILTADCIINELPVQTDGKPGRVTIAQIHGKDAELSGLQSDGTFYDDKGDPVTGRMKRFKLLLPSGAALPPFPVGARFTYEIRVDAGKLTVSVLMNGAVYSNVDPIAAAWNSDVFYFKAGSYCQVGKDPSSTTGKGRASVSLSGVKVVHV